MKRVHVNKEKPVEEALMSHSSLLGILAVFLGLQGSVLQLLSWIAFFNFMLMIQKSFMREGGLNPKKRVNVNKEKPLDEALMNHSRLLEILEFFRPSRFGFAITVMICLLQLQKWGGKKGPKPKKRVHVKKEKTVEEALLSHSDMEGHPRWSWGSSGRGFQDIVMEAEDEESLIDNLDAGMHCRFCKWFHDICFGNKRQC